MNWWELRTERKFVRAAFSSRLSYGCSAISLKNCFIPSLRCISESESSYLNARKVSLGGSLGMKKPGYWQQIAYLKRSKSLYLRSTSMIVRSDKKFSYDGPDLYDYTPNS